MTRVSTIYEPSRPGNPFIAAIFDGDGRIVASHGFPTRDGAEAFLKALAGDGHEPTGARSGSATDDEHFP